MSGVRKVRLGQDGRAVLALCAFCTGWFLYSWLVGF